MIEESKKWYEIIFEHWTQIVFILGSIGVVFTAIMNWYYKKKEIRFSRLQENKIIEIKDFYKSYFNLETEIKKYYFQVEYGAHSEEIFNEIRSKISIATLDFEYHLRVVRLFMNENQIELIEKLKNKIEEVRKNASLFLIYKNQPERKIFSEKLTDTGEKIIPIELPELLKKLEDELKKDII